jgi:hypothetical protein
VVKPSRLLLPLLLCPAPLFAHPGDHMVLQVTARDQTVEGTLDVPAAMLASIDANGDFLLSPEEGQHRRRQLQALVQNGLEIRADGVPVRPGVDILPRPLWNKPPADLLKRADEPVRLQLQYRWPWELRNLEIRNRWFPPSAQADCALTVSAFGQTSTARLTPNANHYNVGAPRSLLAIAYGVWRPTLLLTITGVAARSAHLLPPLVAALSGTLLAPWLPAAGWTGLLACLLLASLRPGRWWPAAALLAAWVRAPLFAPAPALGTALALLAALVAGRKLTPEQGVVCLCLAALFSFSA